MKMNKLSIVAILGICFIGFGTYLVIAPYTSGLSILGTSPANIIWNYPDTSHSSALVADLYHVPWIIFTDTSSTNYFSRWHYINNFLGDAPWAINGTLTVTGTGLGTPFVSKLRLGFESAMQTGYKYDMGLDSDWQTFEPCANDTIPRPDQIVVQSQSDPNTYYLCTQGVLYKSLIIGNEYTFTWNINTPEGILSTVGYGRIYYDIQGNWYAGTNILSRMYASNVTTSNLELKFIPTVGAGNISRVFVSLQKRGDIASSTHYFTNYSGNWKVQINLVSTGLYDLNFYIIDIAGNQQYMFSTVIVYGQNTLPTQYQFIGIGDIGIGSVMLSGTILFVKKKEENGLW